MLPKVLTNYTELPYKMNLFAATMLLDGIYVHFKMVKRYHRKRLEDPDYCVLMMSTVRKEAIRLSKWLNKIGMNHLTRTKLEDIESLLVEIDNYDAKLRLDAKKFLLRWQKKRVK